jgi:Nuclease-related domain
MALILLLVAIALGVRARYWSRLATRSRVGARSEEEVQRALAPPTVKGWRLRHSLPWQGRGDIDSVAIAPTGIAFAIETKTRTFDDRHVARVHEMANWPWTRRRRWCPQGALAVLCVVHARPLERVEAGVLILSLDRLVEALQTAAARARWQTVVATYPSSTPTLEFQMTGLPRDWATAGQHRTRE